MGVMLEEPEPPGEEWAEGVSESACAGQTMPLPAEESQAAGLGFVGIAEAQPQMKPEWGQR